MTRIPNDPVAAGMVGKPQSVNVVSKNFKLRLESPVFVSKNPILCNGERVSTYRNRLLPVWKAARQIWFAQ